jgi:hypothetical protein
MPAASEAPEVRLPRTFRPYGVRIAASVFGSLLLVAVAVMWWSFPPRIRAEFTAFQVITLLALGAMFYGAGFALARSRVVARRDGLTVVNGYRARRFEWSQVLKVTLRPGSPWAVLDLSDGTTLSAMGIQGSDGARARKQARELQRLVDVMSAPR